jgi:predicted RND superfamily exporter protein
LTGLFRSSDAEDKQVIILVTLIICIIIAIFLNFVNVKSDYDDLLDFYSGFLGR